MQRRNDRREHITKEIAKVCSDKTKVYRIDAVACEPGALGCTLSHQTLEHPEWSHVLVLEDDFTFRDDINVEDVIQRLVTHDASMDVILFAIGSASLHLTSCDGIFKVESSRADKKTHRALSKSKPTMQRRGLYVSGPPDEHPHNENTLGLRYANVRQPWRPAFMFGGVVLFVLPTPLHGD